jgi:hypothetical protein
LDFTQPRSTASTGGTVEWVGAGRQRASRLGHLGPSDGHVHDLVSDAEAAGNLRDGHPAGVKLDHDVAPGPATVLPVDPDQSPVVHWTSVVAPLLPERDYSYWASVDDRTNVLV